MLAHPLYRARKRLGERAKSSKNGLLWALEDSFNSQFEPDRLARLQREICCVRLSLPYMQSQQLGGIAAGINSAVSEHSKHTCTELAQTVCELTKNLQTLGAP